MADKTPDRDVGHAMFGLNEPETRRSGPGEGPGAAPAASGGKALSWLVGILLVVSAANLFLAFFWHQQTNESLSRQGDQLTLLSRRLDSTDQRYADLSGQFRVKLGLSQQEAARARALAADIQKQQQQAVTQLNDAIAMKASAEEVNKIQADANAKIGGLSTDLAGTKQDLEATKQALTGAKGELTGAIARTHDELVDLAHRSDRDYFEFNLARKGARQKIGTVLIELKRTNPKKNQYTVSIAADDKVTERPNKSVNEPLYFYVQGASSALELVVNKLGKDSISGYVSAPKGFLTSTPNVLSARPGG